MDPGILEIILVLNQFFQGQAAFLLLFILVVQSLGVVNFRHKSVYLKHTLAEFSPVQVSRIQNN